MVWSWRRIDLRAIGVLLWLQCAVILNITELAHATSGLTFSDSLNPALSATALQLRRVNVSFVADEDVAVSLRLCDSLSPWLSFERSSFNVASGAQSRAELRVLVDANAVLTTPEQAPSQITGCAILTAVASDDSAVVTNVTIALSVTVILPCGPGTSSASGTNSPDVCLPCPLGTYSGQSGSTVCTPCPEDWPLTASNHATSSTACLKCPLGFYCPIGMTPQVCPARGGYEPLGATVKDRSASDCVARPCEAGFWCGAGAAEGSTYVRNLVFEQSVSAAAVLGLERSVPLVMENVFGAGGAIEIKPNGTLPLWLSFDANMTLAPFAGSSPGQATMTTAYFIDNSSPIFGVDSANATVIMAWFRLSKPEELFYFSLDVTFEMVTVIVTPPTFVYSATIGSATLTPPLPTEIDVFNTMCNNGVVMTISASACDGQAFPPWFQLLDEGNPFAPRAIEEQAGLPTVIKFELDPTRLLAHGTSSVDPNARFVSETTPAAVFEKTCVHFDFIVNGPNIPLSRQVDLSFRLLKPCPPGTFSLTGDDAEGCKPCNLDSYQAQSGKTFCNKCPEALPRTRQPGTVSENDCLVDRGRFRLNNGSLACPRAAKCDAEVGLTVRTIAVRDGYWRANPNSLNILECPRPKYCRGGRIVSPREISEVLLPTTGTQDGRRLAEDLEANDTMYVDNQCISNHTGPFCYDCTPGSTKRTVEKICQQCTDSELAEDRGRVAGLFFLFSFLILSALAFVYFYTRRLYFISEGQSERTQFEIRVSQIFTALDITIPMQIFISFLQVVSSMSNTFRDVLPPFYAQIRNIFALLALDLVNILDFGCALSAQNHYSSLLLSTLLPIIFCIVLYMLGYLLQHLTKTQALKSEFKNTTYTVFLVTTFLVYPMCSNKVLATFVCLELDNGVRVLATDPSVSCTSQTYSAYFGYAVFMTIVYPVGIPILYSVLLWMERKTMYSYYSDNVKLAVAMRANNKDVRYLKFLWRPYKPRFFYFEVFELVRKLAQTSIVVFIAPGSSPQIVFQLLTTVISVVVLNSFTPYMVYADALLALVAQWTLFGISLVTLLIKFNQAAQVSVSAEYNQDALDVLLTVMFFSVPCAAVIRASTQILGEIFRLVSWLPCAGWYQRYLIWRDGFILDRRPEKKRRKSLAQRPERFMAKAKRRLSIPTDLQDEAVAAAQRAKEEEDEARLLETKDGALEVLEKLRARFLHTEKELLSEIETEKDENDQISQERQMIRSDIERLEGMLQSMKVAQIQQKEEKEEEEEKAKAAEDEANDASIFSGRRASMIGRRPTLMAAIRRRSTKEQGRSSDLEAGLNGGDRPQSPTEGGEAASGTPLFSFGRKTPNPESEPARRKATDPTSGGDTSRNKKTSSLGGETSRGPERKKTDPDSLRRTVTGAIAGLTTLGRRKTPTLMKKSSEDPEAPPAATKETRSSFVVVDSVTPSQLPEETFAGDRGGSSTVQQGRESTIRLDSMSEML